MVRPHAFQSRKKRANVWKLEISYSSCTQWTTTLCLILGRSKLHSRWDGLMCLGAHQTQVHDVLGAVHVEPMQCLKGGMFVLAKSAKCITANLLHTCPVLETRSPLCTRSHTPHSITSCFSWLWIFNLFLSWCFCLAHSTLHPFCSLFCLGSRLSPW